MWGIENAPVLCAYLWIFFTRRTRPLSPMGYWYCTGFLILHEIGAHYTYQRVPVGYWIGTKLGSTRNDYDRVVHFAFGLTATYAAWEAFRRNIQGSLLTLYWLCFWLTLWLSALYEIGEAYVLKLAPDAGVVFLASQGDAFDAQSDMACAMVGSLLCLAAIALAGARESH